MHKLRYPFFAVTSTEVSLSSYEPHTHGCFSALSGICGTYGKSICAVFGRTERATSSHGAGVCGVSKKSGERNRAVSKQSQGRLVRRDPLSLGLFVSSQIKHGACARAVSCVHQKTNEVWTAKETQNTRERHAHGRGGNTNDSVLQEHTRESTHCSLGIFRNTESRTVHSPGQRLFAHQEQHQDYSGKRNEGRSIRNNTRVFRNTLGVSGSVSPESGGVPIHYPRAWKSVPHRGLEKTGACRSKKGRLYQTGIPAPVQAFDVFKHAASRREYRISPEPTTAYTSRNDTALRKLHRLHRQEHVPAVRSELFINRDLSSVSTRST